REFFLDGKTFIGGSSPATADFRLAATLEFLPAIDYDAPQWVRDYLAAMESQLGDAYTEPANDVRGYIAYVKGVGCAVSALAEGVRDDGEAGRLGGQRGRARAGEAVVEARVELQRVGRTVREHGQAALDRQGRLVGQDRHGEQLAQRRQLPGVGGRDRLLDV